jgi:predicted AAA+ superfamily ATPase
MHVSFLVKRETFLYIYPYAEGKTMKDVFKQIIIDNQEKDYNYVLERDIDFPLESNKIIAFTGVRRSGKTHVMYYAIKKLKEKVSHKNIVFINFEDDRIFPLTLNDLGTLPEAYYELFPENKNEKVYFFFDEVQVVENWEKFIRRLYDTENCQIFISGSSSKLLSSEIATSLRGRTLTFEVFPLSFKEYLNFSGINADPPFSSKSKATINHYLQRYLQYGGFPELIYSEERFVKQILQEYLDMIIYKDLIERYSVNNHYLLKYLVKYCMLNIGTLLSYNKLFNELKSRGLQISKNTLYNYIQYLEETYAVFSVPLYSRSYSEVSKNPKKIYSIDVGFKTAIGISEDIGHKYENIVFLHLRRKSKNIYYWKLNKEVDFILNDDELQIINVTYDLSDPKTYEREMSGLEEAMLKTKKDKSLLINLDKKDIVKTGSGTIQVIPLWEWLLK